MFVTIRTNAIEHADADCNCVPGKKLCQHCLNGLPPSSLPRQNVSFINKPNDAKEKCMPTAQYRDNVISINAAGKSATKPGAQKAGNVKFNYPMLECV
jgi:hypothetical protein